MDWCLVEEGLHYYTLHCIVSSVYFFLRHNAFHYKFRLVSRVHIWELECNLTKNNPLCFPVVEIDSNIDLGLDITFEIKVFD